MSLNGLQAEDVTVYNFRARSDGKQRTAVTPRQLEEPPYDFSVPTPDYSITRPGFPKHTSLPLTPAALPVVTSLPVAWMTSLPPVPPQEDVYADVQPLFYSDERPKARSVIVPSTSRSLAASNPYHTLYGSSPVLAYQANAYTPNATIGYIATPLPLAPKKPAAAPAPAPPPARKQNLLWHRFPCTCVVILVLCAFMAGGIIAVVLLVKMQ